MLSIIGVLVAVVGVVAFLTGDDGSDDVQTGPADGFSLQGERPEREERSVDDALRDAADAADADDDAAVEELPFEDVRDPDDANQPPVAIVPDGQTLDDEGFSEIIGVRIDDPESAASNGTVGVLLGSKDGAIELASTGALFVYGTNNSGFIAVVGPYDEVNRTVGRFIFRAHDQRRNAAEIIVVVGDELQDGPPEGRGDDAVLRIFRRR